MTSSVPGKKTALISEACLMTQTGSCSQNPQQRPEVPTPTPCSCRTPPPPAVYCHTTAFFCCVPSQACHVFCPSTPAHCEAPHD